MKNEQRKSVTRLLIGGAKLVAQLHDVYKKHEAEILAIKKEVKKIFKSYINVCLEENKALAESGEDEGGEDE